MMQWLNLLSIARGYIESVSLPAHHNGLLFGKRTWEMTSARPTVSHVHTHLNTCAYTSWAGRRRHTDSVTCTCWSRTSVMKYTCSDVGMQTERLFCGSAGQTGCLAAHLHWRFSKCERRFTWISPFEQNKTTQEKQRHRHIHIHGLTCI